MGYVNASFDIGNTPLFIEDVFTSCGCTTSQYTASFILPGKEGEITAIYDASSLGKVFKTVTVKFKEIKLKKDLVLKGKVIKRGHTIEEQ